MKLKLWKWEVELKRESAEEAAARVDGGQETGWDSKHSREVEAQMARLWKSMGEKK